MNIEAIQKRGRRARPRPLLPPRLLSLAVALALTACSDPAGVGTGGPCETASDPCADRIAIGPGLYLPYYRTFPLSQPNPEIEEAVIFVHGANRDADFYFETMVLATSQAGRLRSALVIAPHFQAQADGPGTDEPYWTTEGWKRGHLSVPGGPSPRTSSYQALDRILLALLDRSRFPNLERIVVSGHSAGGQVVHRYAAGSRVEELHPEIAFRYVVANPSTYLYLDATRALGEDFAVPDTQCFSYDNWHLGLSNLNSYMAAVGREQARANLTTRDVRILIGDQDRGDALLDQSCGANFQGEDRFDRGRTLVRYMDARFPGHEHLEMIVPGVGHSSRLMFTSVVGLDALYGGATGEP